jgi:hypothetical protein
VRVLQLFIYAVLGVSMFTFVAQGDPLLDAHGGINEQRNFVDIGHALLLLLQCLTGDGWSSVMASAMIDEESGKCSDARGDCGSPFAIPYFISFQIVGSFIFLNLVVAVILENFANLYFTSPDLVSSSDLEVFSEAWQQFDPVRPTRNPRAYPPTRIPTRLRARVCPGRTRPTSSPSSRCPTCSTRCPSRSG